MIQVKQLHKAFDGHPVLIDVNAEIQSGEIISIIGPSGTGKSTFLRCLNLLERPDGGEIWINGVNILDHQTNVPALRMKMGMVFQQFNLFPHLTVLENIMFAPRELLKCPRAEAEAKARALLERVGLAGKADALPLELSGGQQQRVAIARTLAMNPEIILFDEPTSALDPTMVNEVLSVIRSLAKTGITMIIVTHEMRFARDVSTRIFYMDEGIIYEQGPAKALFDSPSRPKTRAFLRRIGMLNFALQRSDFDLYHVQAQIETFAEKQLLEPRQRKQIQLVTEELLVNLLLPRTTDVTLTIEISEETRGTELTATWHGTENPLIATDELSEMPRLIINKSCANIDFQILEAGIAQLKLTLDSNQK